MSEIAFIKKISTKMLGYEKKQIRKMVEKAPCGLYRVYGLATGVRYGDGDNGPWIKFVGQFEAVNMSTGALIRSGELFLPNNVTPILESQIIAGKGEDKFKGIQFALEIGAKEDEESAVGYVYTSKDLMPSDAKTDFLAQLRKEHVDDKLLAKSK